MTNEERLALWATLYESAGALGIPTPPQIVIGIRVQDGGGAIVLERMEEGHSWTRNYYNYLFSVCTSTANIAPEGDFGAGHLSAKDTSGVVNGASTRMCHRNGTNFYYGFVNNITTSNVICSYYGIVPGTSDQAFSPEDYKLASQVPWAYGAGVIGSLEYQAMPRQESSYADKTWTTSLTRGFKNRNAGSVSVKEVGLIGNGYYFKSTAGYALMARDVLEATITVPYNHTLTITYYLSTDFSTIDL